MQSEPAVGQYSPMNICVICGFVFVKDVQTLEGVKIECRKFLSKKLKLTRERISMIQSVVEQFAFKKDLNKETGICIKCFNKIESVIKSENKTENLKSQINKSWRNVNKVEEDYGKEKICSVLRESVLNLCKENYNCAIEIDGLICISVVNSKEQHIVKLHDLLTENGQLFTSSFPKSNENKNKTQTNFNRNLREIQPRPAMFVQNNNIQSSNNPSVSSSEKRQRPGASIQVTSENSARFPFLIQTLQESRNIQYNPDNRASSASPTVPLGEQTLQNRSTLFGSMVSSNAINTDRPASNLLKILSSKKQQQEQHGNENRGDFNEKDNFEFLLSVKKEPVDEEITDQGLTTSSHDMGGNSMEFLNEKPETINIKPEPNWNESEYGGTSTSKQMEQSDADSSQGSQIGSNNETSKIVSDARNKHETFSSGQINDAANQHDPVAKKNKSILANILNGREEQYTRSRNSLIGLSKDPKLTVEKSEEQDNSLLYRLPFVTFQDLFPGGPTGDTQMSQHSDACSIESLSEEKEKSSAKPGMNLELLMRKMLEDKSPAKRQRPQRKRKKTPVTYCEPADFSSDEEEDIESPSSDKDDDVYVPPKKDLNVDTDDQEYTSSPCNKKAKKNTRKRSVAIKSTAKMSKAAEYSKDKNISEAEKIRKEQSHYRYVCSHCQLRFMERLERDLHEEENCIKELIVCHICKGYFANTSSRNKHLWEVHMILSDEQKDEIKENRKGALEEFKTISKVSQDQQYEFETLKDHEETNASGLVIESIESLRQPDFDIESSSVNSKHEKTLVTKFIVPFSKKNSDSFIKCPLCINMFSDLASKDEHLRKKHKIANQIDNGDGTVSLQLLENTPSNVPPVFVKFEKTQN